jgi:hypothetical protein
MYVPAMPRVILTASACLPMQVSANRQLVRNRVRLGLAMYAASVGIFVIGLIVSGQSDPSSPAYLSTWLAIIVGTGVWFFALSQLRRWAPRQRQETQVADAISDLDDRYKLYAFLGGGLPDYVLAGPGGVHVLVVRHERGQISCERDRWNKAGQGILSAVFGAPFGNPTAEAREQLQKIQQMLVQEGFDHVPASALIVFTNENARLRVEGCTVPVTKLKGLQEALRRAAGKGRNVALSAAQIREIRTVLDRRMQAAHAWR